MRANKNLVCDQLLKGITAVAVFAATVATPVLAQAPAATPPTQLQTQVQQVYRWLDKDGKVVYSDQPPPADAKQPQTKRLGGLGGGANEELSYAAAEAARKNPVTLFVNGCGEACDKARRILSDRGVPHTTKNPELTKEIGDELKRLSGETNVPFMVIGEAAMRGFEENAWNLALDNAGYPRAGVLTKKTKAKETAPPPAKPAQPTSPVEPKA